MGIIALLERVFALFVQALSAYNKNVDINNGKRIAREDMYEEMVERTEKAKSIHALDVDELVRLRRERKDSL